MADEHDEKTKSGRVSRRGLLGGGAVLGVTAGAAGMIDAAQATPAEPDDDPRRLTYRETEHIRAFYRRSRI